MDESAVRQPAAERLPSHVLAERLAQHATEHVAERLAERVAQRIPERVADDRRTDYDIRVRPADRQLSRPAARLPSPRALRRQPQRDQPVLRRHG